MTEQTAFQPKPVTIITSAPTVEVIAEMALNERGVMKMADWVKSHRPECTPESGYQILTDLLPHNGLDLVHSGTGDEPEVREVADNELLVELAGRKCYDSFSERAGQKTNREYIANTQNGPVPHASIMYHAKMTFFIAGVSRRVSHELIRNYVGADRSEEGAPSQESTRFTHHYGWYVASPRDLQDKEELEVFRFDMQNNYDSYCRYINHSVAKFSQNRGGGPELKPTGMDRKRIYEAASQRLSHACETSFIWTTNPAALAKLFKERCDSVADLEFQRLALKWQDICHERWPNLFMRKYPEAR